MQDILCSLHQGLTTSLHSFSTWRRCLCSASLLSLTIRRTWLSTVGDRALLLLLPILGSLSVPTCLMSLSHPLFLFSVDASRLSSSGISSYDFLLQLFYIMTVVIFRHLNHAFCSKSIKVQHFWSFVCINMAFLNFIHSQLWLMVWQQHPVCKK